MTSGTYGGATFGSFGGIGGGLYIDSRGRIYPQAYGGTPGFGVSAGYTPDLEGLLTGPSVSGSVGTGSFRYNLGTSGTANGVGFGTPGVGVTYGFGPLDMAQDYSRPWTAPFVRDSAAAAGVPSRQNVWEYDYPNQPAIPEQSARGARPSERSRPASAASDGPLPIPFLPGPNTPRGLPGMMIDAGYVDPTNPNPPPAGGLAGLLQDYLRNNLGAYR